MPLELEPASARPKIVQKLLLRTSLFLVIGAVVFGALRWVQERKGDFDDGGTSVGDVAAIRIERDGQQAVILSPDGKARGTKSWKPNVTDREPAWSPDGKFLFFCSDREEQTFHVYRWNPDKDDADQRTIGRISRGNPTFQAGGPNDTLLVVAGGTVRELDPTTKKTPQILPPASAEIAQSAGGDEGQGTESAVGAAYGALGGKSFRIARYFAGKRFVAAIMRRDEGELLFVQDLQLKDGKSPRPVPVMAGDRIDMDVNPKDDTLVFSIQNFRWPDPAQAPEQFRKGNRLTVPFRNLVGIYDPTVGQPTVVDASLDDKAAFAWPRVSPDGARLLIVQGSLEEGSLKPQGLLSMPCVAQGARSASPLVQGNVYEPSWSSDGSKIVYVKRVGGKRDVFTMNADGSGDASVTKGQGDFSTPIFSPQTTK